MVTGSPQGDIASCTTFENSRFSLTVSGLVSTPLSSMMGVSSGAATESGWLFLQLAPQLANAAIERNR
jgi:hypothetical protein